MEGSECWNAYGGNGCGGMSERQQLYINRLLDRMSEDHTVMHAVSLYGNAKWSSP